MKLSLVSLLLVLFTIVLAGCGSAAERDGSQTKAEGGPGYPNAVRETFIGACESTSKGATAPCTKFLDCLEERVTYDDFKKADAAVSKGEEAPKVYRDALPACTKAMTS